jgi:hypothetical protein
LRVRSHADPGPVGDQGRVLLEAAQVVGPAPESERQAAGIVVPRHRLEAHRHPVAAHSGAEVAVEVDVGRRIRYQEPLEREPDRLPIVQHVPVVRPHQGIQQHGPWLGAGRDLDPLPLGTPFGSRHGGIAHGNDGDVLRKAPVGAPDHLDPSEVPVAFLPDPHPTHGIVEQLGPVQPLGKEGRQVTLGDLLGDGAKRGLVYVVVLPPLVEGAQDPVHRRVADDGPKLVKEQLAPSVDRDLIGGEIAVVLAHEAGGLRVAVQVELQDLALGGRVRLTALNFPEPGGLEAGEPLVQPAFPPFIVGQESHRVVVADLVHDEPLIRRAVVHHHRELGAPALDPMHVGDLGPAERSVQPVEPGERRLGPLDRGAAAPGLLVTGLI